VSSGRLDRVRVAVTRPRGQAETWSEALSNAGAEVVICPLTDIVQVPGLDTELSARLRSLTIEDRVVVTSPNGARRLGDALELVAADGTPFVTPVVVVGEATAQPLAPRVPENQIITATMPRGEGSGRVLVLRGNLARSTVAEALGRRGWIVEDLVVYETRPRDLDAHEREAVLGCDVITLASGSAARAWARVQGRDIGPAVVVIGPVTHQDAVAARLTVAAQAIDPSPKGLIDAIARVVGGIEAESRGTPPEASDSATRSPRPSRPGTDS
jgi:uroporphyrinogen-III synthase